MQYSEATSCTGNPGPTQDDQINCLIILIILIILMKQRTYLITLPIVSLREEEGHATFALFFMCNKTHI
jgi:hypothetical protein